MSQSNPTFQHTILARLDAAIEQFEVTLKAAEDTKQPDTQSRRNQYVLLQTRQEILNVREAAVDTLTRLNTFGATLDIMAEPEVGVKKVVNDVLNWFVLLTVCDRALISLYSEGKKIFEVAASVGWLDGELRPEEQTISEAVIKNARQTREIFSSSNMDMASEQYQKSGSWRIPLRTVFGVPLLWNDKLIGVFYGDRKISSGTVSQDMMPLVKLYAAQAAIAIRNAQLFATLATPQKGNGSDLNIKP